jgi:hypothetical protein
LSKLRVALCATDVAIAEANRYSGAAEGATMTLTQSYILALYGAFADDRAFDRVVRDLALDDWVTCRALRDITTAFTGVEPKGSLDRCAMLRRIERCQRSGFRSSISRARGSNGSKDSINFM